MFRSEIKTVVGMCVAACLALGATATQSDAASTEVAITDIQLFNTGGGLNNRGDEGNAIDGDINTWSFLTPSGTQGPHIAGLDLGGLNQVNAIRVAKWGDTDDAGASGSPGIIPTDSMDIQILYTTDGGALNTRTYSPVSGLTNDPVDPIVSGLSSGGGVNSANGTVDNDNHDFTTDGWYQLNFDKVSATAIAIRFERDAGDNFGFTHYRSYEIQALVPEPASMALMGLGGLMLLRRKRGH